MSRQKIIKKLKNRNPKLVKSELELIINTFCNCIEKAIIEGRNIELRGFGSFTNKKIKEKYSARNPKTGDLIYVPEKNRVRFKSSKKLNKLINT